ncbi:MAG: PEP-CTERM sorting domain-containing protein [Puniceicoccaceae bacterium]
MKKRLLLLSAAVLALAVTASAQITLNANAGASGRTQWAPTSGPAHLGQSGVPWGPSDGSWNDTGDTIVGDAGNNQNFQLNIGFDTTAAFRSAVAGGGTVTLTGTSLFGVDDGFGGTIAKTEGNVSWSPIFVTLSGYGNSAIGTFGDTTDGSSPNAFIQIAAANGTGAATNATFAYTVGPNLSFSGDPYSADSTFTVDITSMLSSLPLDASNDRIMLSLAARVDSPYDHSNDDGLNDRIAFYSSSFQVTAVPEPSTYAAIFGFLALAGVIIRRRLQNR